MAGHWSGLQRRGQWPGVWLADVAFALGIALAVVNVASAQATGRYPQTLPNTTITSDTGDSGSSNTGVNVSDTEAAPPAAIAPTPEHVAPHVRHREHHMKRVASSYAAEVEPTHAMLKLKTDAWAYERPATSSRTLERVHSGKFIDVTGSTHYYVQVKLKNDATGYVPMSAVELARPQNKVLRLSTDAGVLSEPNRYGRKLAEVHQGHDVHVVGTALNYLEIKMKDGLQGYIPMTAVE